MSPQDISVNICVADVAECEKYTQERGDGGVREELHQSPCSRLIQRERYSDLTHAQEQALILLDGAQATEEARYHDDGADGDDHVGS